MGHMESPVICVACGHRGHSSRICPELTAPLRGGFMKPPSGQPQGGDDDDERSRLRSRAQVKLKQPRALRIGRHVVLTTTGSRQRCLMSAPSALIR